MADHRSFLERRKLDVFLLDVPSSDGPPALRERLEQKVKRARDAPLCDSPSTPCASLARHFFYSTARLPISRGWRTQRPSLTFKNAIVGGRGRIEAIPMFGAAAAPDMAMAVPIFKPVNHLLRLFGLHVAGRFTAYVASGEQKKIGVAPAAIAPTST